MKDFLSKHILKVGVVILIGVWAAMVINNYIPGTTLTGWDNLHPEFNLPVNISRSLTAVWQEYQGLGLLGGMAHAADLPRQIILAIASTVVPVTTLRYLWAFLMLLIGPLGVFYLVNWITKRIENRVVIALAALSSGIFYMLNLATVQNFYNPFESFIGFYGFLPWLVYLGINYLNSGRKKVLILYSAISVIATTGFYIQTLFVVYLMLLAPFVLETIIRSKKKGIIRSLKLLIITLIINAFWLLPVAYFTVSSTSVVTSSKGQSLSTPETKLLNQGFSHINDTAILRGYWFEYTEFSAEPNEQPQYLLAPWRDQIDKTVIENTGYLLFGISSLGIFSSFLRKGKYKFAWILGGVMSFYMLSFGLPQSVPILGQAFRSNYTKWSAASAFMYAIGIGLFFGNIYSTRISSLIRRIIFGILTVVVLLGSYTVVKPIFQGQLIYDSMQLTMPQAYFDLFDYFKTQPKQARIAFYPAQSFWGWNFYNWNYRGSGFLWYGIEQPILDRAFDVWSAQNETFYDEISTAVYANDETLVKSVLDKYDVSYMLIDQSVVIPGGDNKNLRFEQMQEMLSSMGAKLAFEKDFLQVWDVAAAVGNTKQFIYTPEFYVFAKADNLYSRLDPVFRTNNAYVQSSSKLDQISYPFSSYNTEKSDEVEYTNTLDGSTQISLKQAIPANGELVIPAVDLGTQIVASATVSMANKVVKIEFDSMFEVWADERLLAQANLPVLELPLQQDYSRVIVSIAGKQVELSSNDEKRISGIVLDPNQNLNVDIFDGLPAQAGNGLVPTSESFLTSPINTCWTKEGSKGNVIANRTAESLRMSTVDAVGCMAFKLGNFESDKILMKVSLPYKSEGVGKPHFCITVEGAADCVTDDIFYHSSVSHEWSEVSRELVLDGTVPYWMVISARPPDEVTGEWAINYKNPRVLVYKKLEGFSFTNLMDGISVEQKIRIPDDAKSFSVSVMASPIDVDIATSGRSQAYNCDVFKRGSVEKTVLGSSVEYKAADLGASCDYAVLGEIRTDQSYLLRVMGENKSGRSSKIYLYNKANSRNDIEDLLPHGSFDVTYTILPWVNYDANEYILNTETRSFGREQAVNQINKISLYQVPINWIAKWHIVPDGAEKQYTNELQISNVKKYGTWAYTADVKGSGLIVLSQGYDSGWVSSNGFEHVKTNGWANGFLVDNYDGQITIFYWPQFLEFAGFAALGIGFVLLLRRKLTK